VSATTTVYFLICSSADSIFLRLSGDTDMMIEKLHRKLLYRRRTHTLTHTQTETQLLVTAHAQESRETCLRGGGATAHDAIA